VGVTASAPSAGAASISPAQAKSLVTSAFTATANAPSVTIVGNGTSGKQTMQFDLSFSSAAADGSIVLNGQQLVARRIGVMEYEKASKGFLKANGVSSADAAALANQWLSVPASDKSDYASLKSLLNEKQFMASLTPAGFIGKVTGATRTTLAGKPVYKVQGTFSGTKATVYVAAQGTPYVVRIVQPTGSDIGTISFSGYGQPVNVQTPANAIPE
jgi:hypothetical protein